MGCTDEPAVSRTDTGPFLQLAGHGEATLASSEHAVFALDGDGRARLLQASEDPVGVELAPDGAHYGVYRDGGFELHDLRGALLARMAGSPLGLRFKLIGEGRVLAPVVELHGPEDGRVLGLELRDVDGRVRARFTPPEGVRFSRPSGEHVTLATSSRIVRYALDGSEQWSFALQARELAVAAHADRVVVVPESDSRRLVVLAGGKPLAGTDLREPIWNVALSSDGERVAVITQHSLHALSGGRLQLNLKLPLTYATSLALADDGRMLVGGRKDDRIARVLCYAPDGKLLAEQALDADDQAFRPALRWRDDERYLALTASGPHAGRCPRGGER